MPEAYPGPPALHTAQLGAPLVNVPGADHFTLPAVVADQVVARTGQLFG